MNETQNSTMRIKGFEMILRTSTEGVLFAAALLAASPIWAKNASAPLPRIAMVMLMASMAGGVLSHGCIGRVFLHVGRRSPSTGEPLTIAEDSARMFEWANVAQFFFGTLAVLAVGWIIIFSPGLLVVGTQGSAVEAAP